MLIETIIYMELEKETKNTFRYAERKQSSVVGTLYIQKWAIRGPAPSTIRVAIKEVKGPIEPILENTHDRV